MAFKNITYILALWSLKQCAAVRTNPKNELRTRWDYKYYISNKNYKF